MVTRETISRALASMGLLDDDAGRVVARLDRFARLLEDEALPRGFLGPGEGPMILHRHILESAALATHLEPSSTVVDVGSGAGLPGIVLACITKGRVTLLESEGKRARFLRASAEDLELGSVEVVRARAEEAGRREGMRDSFDAAVARALAPPPVALELMLPLVRPGGRALISVGPTAVSDLVQPTTAAAMLSGGAPRVAALRVPGLQAERWAMIIEKSGPCPERFPRRVGVAARRPLGSGRS